MKIFLQIRDGIVCAADTAEIDNPDDFVEGNSPDEIYKKLEKYNALDAGVEEKIEDIFNQEKSDEHSLLSYNIKHWVSNRSFGELIDMYENEEIMKPEMQREFVWDAQKSSRFIESIIIGLPIPPLFFLEIDKNMYEVIDGYQRLITVNNFVQGKPWMDNNTSKRKVKARLSGDISSELKGKSFDELSKDQQRIIKRSTIPLIEFRQIYPDDIDSKYMIFERINSGSEKLNPMQIRKALAYGPFIKSVYEQAMKCKELRNLYSFAMQKKDVHVEAFLRIYAMSEIYYRNVKCEKNGLKHILNKFCEDHKNEIIPETFTLKVNTAVNIMRALFQDEKKLFRRVVIEDNVPEYTGNMNVCILEAMIGVCVEKNISIENMDIDSVRKKYEIKMDELVKKAVSNTEENPFSTSTGTLNSIISRFKICEGILE